MRAVILIAISTAIAGPAAYGQQRADQDSAGGTRQSNSDIAFVHKAVMSDSVEIALGKLAEERTSNSQVKDFAADMVKDHGKSSKDLRDAAGSARNFPTELDKEHLAIVKKLSKLNGDAFDREYVRVMVKEHEKAAKLLSGKAGQQVASRSETGGPNVKEDNAINEWASKTLPVVQSHLQKAKELQRSLSSNTRSGGSMNRSDSTDRKGGRIDSTDARSSNPR